jgi:hypothetical protein
VTAWYHEVSSSPLSMLKNPIHSAQPQTRTAL